MGSLTINGAWFSFEPGQTIPQVAVEDRIPLLTLCHIKDVSPTRLTAARMIERFTAFS